MSNGKQEALDALRRAVTTQNTTGVQDALRAHFNSCYDCNDKDLANVVEDIVKDTSENILVILANYHPFSDRALAQLCRYQQQVGKGLSAAILSNSRMNAKSNVAHQFVIRCLNAQIVEMKALLLYHSDAIK